LVLRTAVMTICPGSCTYGTVERVAAAINATYGWLKSQLANIVGSRNLNLS
jgi:hypothetical protein